METRYKVIKSYRGLVRAARATFKGDALALNAARERIRSEYTQKGPIERPEMLQRLQMAKDVAHVLRANVVQARKDEERNVYKLGLTQHSELGDNDSRFLPIEHSKEPQSGCCGGQSSAKP